MFVVLSFYYCLTHPVSFSRLTGRWHTFHSSAFRQHAIPPEFSGDEPVQSRKGHPREMAPDFPRAPPASPLGNEGSSLYGIRVDERRSAALALLTTVALTDLPLRNSDLPGCVGYSLRPEKRDDFAGYLLANIHGIFVMVCTNVLDSLLSPYQKMRWRDGV